MLPTPPKQAQARHPFLLQSMSCSVAIAASSPASSFSPSHHRFPLTCKTNSPGTLTLASPSSTSPIQSPFKSSRFNRSPSVLFKSSRSTTPPSPSPNCLAANSLGSFLKRKRLAKIDIPMIDALSFVRMGSDGRKEVEMDGARCSVYYKRGRKRLEMEDRFKVDLDLDGDPQLGGYANFARELRRLQGTLAVSRGIGDSHLKQWVAADPETRILAIKPEFEFLILASDGLWDKVSNREAVDITRPLCIDSQRSSPLSACKKLADLSASRGSNDDISVMIIQLKHFV